ncbi:hypothetical protein ACWT_5960 [Actinoplanes sp. SE50]|uniref:DUF1565 domain-containing protein n=1 Tax=unclassified Actinoplanes TaxID=2626549 RepID=UPI00023EC335|nr:MULTISPECIES: DUF1565 domain-containing protein [unclassified Actinoplanes]AEV86979.1 hypothetical protein ACPL_6092 [Actinoplanes sp. SE50/110]ATO85375.1 hypothetical protein ACWT_5960 [Actinoplanes sp. SE50]SLM02787.1 hypothetical protein ACSP50_6072 [Actinoplanes sp. SE50/110]
MTSLHVATTGADDTDGSARRPLRTINRAAAPARPGDTVVVHAGEYREWVTPRRGGLSDNRRITYRAAESEHVVIKGSERITGWQPDGGTVWTVAVPNTLFGDFNPFVEEVAGRDVKQAGYARRNVYAAGARPFAGERDPVILEWGTATVVVDGEEVHLATDFPAGIDEAAAVPVGGRDLERVRFADAEFEERDGRPAMLTTDLTGVIKDPERRYAAGPIVALTAGPRRVRVW